MRRSAGRCEKCKAAGRRAPDRFQCDECREIEKDAKWTRRPLATVRARGDSGAERLARLIRYLDAVGRDIERRGPAYAAVVHRLRQGGLRDAAAALFGVTPKAMRCAEGVLVREAEAA